jgi:ribonucleoside-triphosphate reductase (thioredoxin)
MDISQKILSDITHHMKYARYIKQELRRESYEDTVTRNMLMHIAKFPQLEQEIRDAYKFVLDRKVLPSMRSMQFGGRPIEVNPVRIFNCAFLALDDVRAFNEIMFLLLGGTGVGYSVQKHHVEKLPEIRKPNPKRTRRFLVGDSIEGWADSVKALMRSYFDGGSKVIFDFRDIRPKGARLVTAGGKAPGPQPLKECLIKLEGILEGKEDGDKLEPIEVHDIVCHIADAVLAGGIRRSALICLFSADDDEMIACKSCQ